MSSIKGIELKSIKYGNDKKEYFFQTSIYLNNKKAGTVYLLNNKNTIDYNWKNDEFCYRCLLIAEEYITNNPINITSLSSMDILINDLLELNEIEKEFKRVSKKGAKILALLKYNKRDTLESDYDIFKEDLLLSFNEWNSSIEEKIKKKYNPVEIRLYKDLSEFIIN